MGYDWTGSAGVFLTRDLLADGYDDKTIARMVRQGHWHRIRRGAFVLGETWRAMDEVGRHRLRARAVLRTAHPAAVLSHVSAVLEHGAPVWGVDLDDVHVTRHDGKSGRREAGVAHHRGALPPELIHTAHDVPVTSPARALLELTTITSVESSLVSTNAQLDRGKVSHSELEAMLPSMQHWPDSLRTDLVVRLADHRCAWPGEARMSHLIWREHLPRPKPQFEVHDERGNLVAILDFAWPELGAFGEFDGRIKYERLRRAGESLEDVVLREKRRQELVTLLTGWVCIRVTWEDLDRPATTARRIRNVLLNRPVPA
jgi:hypothetical protein